MKPIGCLVAGAAHAQADASGYPNKPVRLIVGFTPGSATDVTARLLAQKLNEAWGVTVTVDNVPGAGGTIGSARAAKSAPDGYTLQYGANGAMTIAPGLYTKLAYDPARDFAPISQLLAMGSIVAPRSTSASSCSRSSPARTSPMCRTRARSSSMSWADGSQ